jgi:hypothetical protein
VTWDLLWQHGIEALQPDPTRRHVLLETTLSTSDCNANLHNSGFRTLCLNEIQSSSEFLNSTLVREHPTRRFDLHVDDSLTDCSHPFAARHGCCKLPGKLGNVRMGDPPDGAIGLKQYIRKAQCSDRLKQIENETGEAFDVVMWIRPDVYLFDSLPSAGEILRSRHHRVLVSSKEESQPPGDYLFIAPRSLIWRWHQALFDAHAGEGCPERRWWGPEIRLEHYVAHYKIPLQLYPFLFTLARSNVSADCDRLKNEVLFKSKLEDPTNGDYITPFEMCCRRFPKNLKDKK